MSTNQSPLSLSGPPLRFVLLPTTRYVAWVAIAIGALMAGFSPLWWARAMGAGAAFLLLGSQFVLRSRRPVLILDDSGYRVEVTGKVRFSVRWEEVRRVLHDRAEEALYLDCSAAPGSASGGDRKRNLFLPPRAGFAFTFTDRALLYRMLMEKVGDRVTEIPRFDRALPPASAAPDEKKAPNT